jgi:hypothetical protein
MINKEKKEGVFIPEIFEKLENFMQTFYEEFFVAPFVTIKLCYTELYNSYLINQFNFNEGKIIVFLKYNF